MDNSSGGGTPTQPSSDSRTSEPQFTVPVPMYTHPTQELPVTAPAPTGGQWWDEVSVPQPATPVQEGPVIPYAASPLPAEGPSDAESLRNLALVLLGVAMGFWVFVGIRMVSVVVEAGASDRLLIDSIDRTSAETVTAALIAVLAFGSAIASRLVSGRGAPNPLVWASGAVALGTVVAAIWRLT